MKESRDLENKTKSVEESIAKLRTILQERHPPSSLSAQGVSASAVTVKLGVSQRLQGHEEKVFSLSWAGAGSSSNPAGLYTLASVSKGGEIALWNTRKGTLITKGQISGADAWLMTCAFEKHNCAVLSIGGRSGKCWLFGLQFESQELSLQMKPKSVFQAHENYVSALDFPSHTEVITASGDATCKLWSLENTSVAVSEFKGHTEDVMCLSVCHLNPSLFLSGACDRSVKLWDARDARTCKRSFDWHGGDVNSVCFFPNSVYTYVSASSNGELQIWDIRALHAIGRYAWSRSPISSVGVSSSGRLMISGNERGEIAVSDVFQEHEPAQLLTEHRDKITALEVSPLATSVASCSFDRAVIIYQPLSLRN